MTTQGPGGAWRRGSWRSRPRADRPGADLPGAGRPGAGRSGAGPGTGLSTGLDTEPPPGGQHISTRPSGWPVLRTPKWMLAGAVVLVAGLTLAAWPHHPSTAERAADLRGMVHDLNYDIESCAGGVNDSITALKAIQSGQSHDVKTAVTIANTAAANCSPGNNMQMEDLVQYQAPGSLASFHLQDVVNDLVTWGFPLAQRVQLDVATLVAAKTPAAIERASAQLRHDQQALDAQRSRIDQLITSASTSLSAHVAPPGLPS